MVNSRRRQKLATRKIFTESCSKLISAHSRRPRYRSKDPRHQGGSMISLRPQPERAGRVLRTRGQRCTVI